MTYTITKNHCVKSTQIRSFFWSAQSKSEQIFVFSPNTGKYRPEKTPYLVTSQSVNKKLFWQIPEDEVDRELIPFSKKCRRCEKVSYSESLKNEGSNKRNKGRMHPKRQTKCCKTLNFPTFSRSETSHKVNKSFIITKSWIQIFHQDPPAKTHTKKLYVEKYVELVKVVIKIHAQRNKS